MKSILAIGLVALLCGCGAESNTAKSGNLESTFAYDERIHTICTSPYPTGHLEERCNTLNNLIADAKWELAVSVQDRILVLAGVEESAPSSGASQREDFSPPSTWSTIRLVDEFGDTVGRAAVSQWKSPRQEMRFPYGDVEGRIIVNCDDVWFRFNEQPNLTNTEPQAGGYSRLRVRYRADGERNGTWSAVQQWGGNDISVSGRDNSNAVSVISGASELSIVLPWYGSGNVVFQWDLAGSTNAIRASCN